MSKFREIDISVNYKLANEIISMFESDDLEEQLDELTCVSSSTEDFIVELFKIASNALCFKINTQYYIFLLKDTLIAF